MANVKVTFDYPTTRKSGRPLDVAAIKHVRLMLSADGGESFATIATLPTPQREYTQTELEPGEWPFRAVCVDTAGRESDPTDASILIEDTTPPSAVLNLHLSLV